MSSSTRWWRAEFALAGLLAAAPAAAVMQVAAIAPSSTATPEHVSRYLEDSRPLGAGRLTFFGLHVYDAQLFVPRSYAGGDLMPLPFAIELTYARSLSGKAIADRSYDEIVKLAYGSKEQRSRWREAMATLFPDVKSGQRLAGIHVPGAPTRFYLDGRYLGEVADPEFGRAFFAIWLDPRTSAPDLRRRLLQAP